MMKKFLFSSILLTILSIVIVQGNNIKYLTSDKGHQDEKPSIKHADNFFNLPPVAICQDIIVSANDSCVAIVLPEQVDNGSYDPDGDSLIMTLLPEGPYPLGNNEVILTVTDTTGDYDQCIAYILVVDDSVPTVLTQSITVYLDTNGMASITPDDIDFGSFDNCGIDTMSLDIYNFTCEDIGDNLVTLTVTDYSGNYSFATDNVTVVDTIAPEIAVISDTLLLWPPNHQYEDFELSDFVLSVWDNCSNVTIDDVDITYATSDEPENGTGDGNTYDDILISNECHNISLRKEREGGGNGRVYTIYFELDDGNDQSDTAICYVYVPHNQGSITIDDGPMYEVYGDCDTITGISENEDDSFDNDITGLKNFPNPFVYSTKVEFYLSKKQNVELKIYNIQGSLVKVLYQGLLTEGDHLYTWYGLNTNGQKVEKGIYFMRFITNEKVQVRRVVKL
jgi:hypothetical protein